MEGNNPSSSQLRTEAQFCHDETDVGNTSQMKDSSDDKSSEGDLPLLKIRAKIKRANSLKTKSKSEEINLFSCQQSILKNNLQCNLFSLLLNDEYECY